MKIISRIFRTKNRYVNDPLLDIIDSYQSNFSCPENIDESNCYLHSNKPCWDNNPICAIKILSKELQSKRYEVV
jgi:hypothetical protein